MKTQILLWIILVIFNVLMWQYFLSTRVEFETLPSYDIDKDLIILPHRSENNKV